MAPFAQCVNPYWLFSYLALLSFGDALCYRPSLGKRLLMEHWYRTRSPLCQSLKQSLLTGWLAEQCLSRRWKREPYGALQPQQHSLQPSAASSNLHLWSVFQKKKIPTGKNGIVLSFLNFWWLFMLNNGLIHFFPAEINILWPVIHSCRKDVGSWSQQE